MSVPFISLIIPTHARAHFLRRALASINAQISRDKIEIIVVSDVPDLQTNQVCFEMLHERDIFLVRNGESGPSASRNIALKLASGLNIMFLDDDDAWDQNFMKNLLSIKSISNGNFFHFSCTVIKESRAENGPIKLNEIPMNLEGQLNLDVYVKNQIHMSCFLFPKPLLNGLNFDLHLRAYEDWDFLLHVFDREMPNYLPVFCSLVYEVDDATSDRRGSSENANNAHAIIDYLYIYRRHAAPNEDVLIKRKKLLDLVGLNLPASLL